MQADKSIAEAVKFGGTPRAYDGIKSKHHDSQNSAIEDGKICFAMTEDNRLEVIRSTSMGENMGPSLKGLASNECRDCGKLLAPEDILECSICNHRVHSAC